MEVFSFLIFEENKFLLVIFNLKLLNFMHRWWCYNYYVFMYTNNIYTGFVFKNCISVVLGFTGVVTVVYDFLVIPGSILVLTHENSNAWLSRVIPEWKSGIQLHRMTWNSSIWIFMIEVSTWHFSDLESIRREKSQISSTSSETWYYKFFVSACEYLKFDMDFVLNDRKKSRFFSFIYVI